MSSRVLHLPRALADALTGAARRAFPSECCGLIEGIAAADGWSALRFHEAANLADDAARRFLVDPKVQFALLRSLRGTERNVIGCFHSHPKGRAAPSAHDLADAAEDGFLWLIAGGTPETGFELAAFVFEANPHVFSSVPQVLEP